MIRKIEEDTESIFKHTNLKIVTEDKKHLEAVTGITNYMENYMNEKIDQWITRVVEVM